MVNDKSKKLSAFIVREKCMDLDKNRLSGTIILCFTGFSTRVGEWLMSSGEKEQKVLKENRSSSPGSHARRSRQSLPAFDLTNIWRE